MLINLIFTSILLFLCFTAYFSCIQKFLMNLMDLMQNKVINMVINETGTKKSDVRDKTLSIPLASDKKSFIENFKKICIVLIHLLILPPSYISQKKIIKCSTTIVNLNVLN